MTKYIKIQVPDDFDSEKQFVALINKPQPTVEIALPIWEPQYVKVLDYGHLGLVDFMGDDNAIVQAARVSYGKGTKSVSTDRGLLRYLMRNLHTTPFEMVEFKFHVKAPIFVFRQWHRHRTFSINEASARYSEMTDEMYLPDPEHLTPQSKDNKQGRSFDTLLESDSTACLIAMQESLEQSYTTYQYLLRADGPLPDLINTRKLWLQESATNALWKIKAEHDPTLIIDEAAIDAKIAEFFEANEFSVTGQDFPGIARELARIVMPVATYTEMYWKGNLKNILHFIGLRSDSHAQYEIRAYSNAMLDMIQPFVPWAVEAFLDYQFWGARLSRMELSAMRDILRDVPEIKERLEYSLAHNGSSAREIREFIERVGLS